MSLTQFEVLARKAVKCRVCFEQGLVHAPQIDIAQPRWIGSDYWSAHPRVAVLMLNPGSGEFRKNDVEDTPDKRARKLIHSFAAGSDQLQEIFEHQRGDMPVWGRGRFHSFYFGQLGLALKSIAFGNIAWCASKGNKYPHKMLHTCFERHTKDLLRILEPNIVLLSGKSAHSFAAEVLSAAPNATVECTLHYAHREGHKKELEEVARLRSVIAEFSRRF